MGHTNTIQNSEYKRDSLCRLCDGTGILELKKGKDLSLLFGKDRGVYLMTAQSKSATNFKGLCPPDEVTH